MFRQMLYVHWKASRFGLIPFVLGAFALPLLSIQGIRVEGTDPGSATVRGILLLEGVSRWTQLYPLLALALGSILALMVWNWDHRGDHVYPLTLPMARWKYVLLKMAAGGTLLLLPVLLLWLGALLAVSVVEIPEGFRGYPNAIGFRFLLASAVSFSLFFALAAGTMRTAVGLLVAWILVVLGGEILVPALGDWLHVPALSHFRFMPWFLNAAMTWPGPFEVYAGNWMLIDI